jgi:hypothetical protein
MKSIGLSLCQLRSSSFHFIDLFPPKESMKEFVENRGRQGWNWTTRQELRTFPDHRGPAPSIKHRHSGGATPNVTNFRWKSSRRPRHVWPPRGACLPRLAVGAQPGLGLGYRWMMIPTA